MSRTSYAATQRGKMTPKEIELKRYNDIIKHLDDIRLYARHNANGVTEPGYSNAFDMISWKAEQAIDLFRLYSERQHD